MNQSNTTMEKCHFCGTPYKERKLTWVALKADAFLLCEHCDPSDGNNRSYAGP